MKSARPLAVRTVQALVGKTVTSVHLEGKDGSRHAVVGVSGGIQSRPLDEILNAQEQAKVRLIKSDVDGFDYDVVSSAEGTILQTHPLIFFECQTDFPFQLDGYKALFSQLQTFGYCDWTLFDNFGEVVLRTDRLQDIQQLLAYVWSQNIGSSTRTIYYFDILGVCQADQSLVDQVLKDYVRDYSRK